MNGELEIEPDLVYINDLKLVDTLKPDGFLTSYFEHSFANPSHIEQEVQNVKK